MRRHTSVLERISLRSGCAHSRTVGSPSFAVLCTVRELQTTVAMVARSSRARLRARTNTLLRATLAVAIVASARTAVANPPAPPGPAWTQLFTDHEVAPWHAPPGLTPWQRNAGIVAFRPLNELLVASSFADVSISEFPMHRHSADPAMRSLSDVYEMVHDGDSLRLGLRGAIGVSGVRERSHLGLLLHDVRSAVRPVPAIAIARRLARATGTPQFFFPHGVQIDDARVAEPHRRGLPTTRIISTWTGATFTVSGGRVYSAATHMGVMMPDGRLVAARIDRALRLMFGHVEGIPGPVTGAFYVRPPANVAERLATPMGARLRAAAPVEAGPSLLARILRRMRGR